MLQHKQGQTISEYGLIMGLGLLIGIAGLLNLSVTLQNGFSNMLTSPASSNPSPGNAGQMAAAPTSKVQANTEIPVVQGPQITTTSSSVQVSGANGGKIYADSQKLLEIAAAYQTNNPTLSNLLIQLGNSGLTLGGTLSDIEIGKLTPLEISVDYGNYDSLGVKVKQSEEYKNLSPAEQVLVANLVDNTLETAMQSVKSATYQYGEPPIQGAATIPASTVVKQNSTTIKGCGENGHC